MQIACFTAMEGPMKGHKFVIRCEDYFRIGRCAESALRLENDLHVSRNHARARLSEKSVIIQDAGSANGTWLDGQRITNKQAVAIGECIQLGTTSLRVDSVTTVDEVHLKKK